MARLTDREVLRRKFGNGIMVRALKRLAAKYAALRERVPFIQAELERAPLALSGSQCATEGCTGQANSLDDDLQPRCFWCWGDIRREKEGV